MATISIKEVNGAAAGTPTTITTPRLCTSDTYNPGTSYPIVKPAAGSNYSYWKSWYLNADTTPAGTINNVKVYTDGSIGWSGVTLKFGTKATYTQATGTQDTTGNDAASGLSITMTDASTYISASPLSITGTIANPSTGKITDYLIVQATVSTSATAGTLSAETITFRYDET